MHSLYAALAHDLGVSLSDLPAPPSSVSSTPIPHPGSPAPVLVNKPLPLRNIRVPPQEIFAVAFRGDINRKPSISTRKPPRSFPLIPPKHKEHKIARSTTIIRRPTPTLVTVSPPPPQPQPLHTLPSSTFSAPSPTYYPSSPTDHISPTTPYSTNSSTPSTPSLHSPTSSVTSSTATSITSASSSSTSLSSTHTLRRVWSPRQVSLRELRAIDSEISLQNAYREQAALYIDVDGPLYRPPVPEKSRLRTWPLVRAS